MVLGFITAVMVMVLARTVLGLACLGGVLALIVR
jgi:hypothetical protein